MPTTTFAQIKARVEANILLVPVDTSNRILGWVQECQRKLEDAHKFRQMRSFYTGDSTNTDGDTNAGLTFFALTSNIASTDKKEILGADFTQDPYFIVGDTGKHVRIEWLQTHRQRQAFYPHPDTASGTLVHDIGPPRFVQLGHLDEASGITINTSPNDGSQIRVFPASDSLNPIGTESALGEYKVRFHLWRRITPLTSADANFFTEQCEYALEYYATWRASLHNGDLEKAATFRPMWLTEKRECIRRDVREQMSTGLTIRPRADYYGNRFTGRGPGGGHRVFRRF